MLKKRFLFLSLLAILTSSIVFADASIQDDLAGFGDDEVVEASDDLLGFEDDSFEDINESESKKEVTIKNYTLTGNIAFKTAVGIYSHKVDDIEYSGINQAQTSLYLQFDSKLFTNWKLRVSGDIFYDAIYDIYDHTYNDDTLDAYKTQLRLDDTYIQGSLTDSLDLKIGRQKVVWGKSDSIRICDVINPLDNRSPGMTDIEDLRLSVAMAKLDYYIDNWNISMMVIGESRIMLETPARSEFFNVDAIFLKPNGDSAAPDPFIPLEKPSSSWENMQYALSTNGTFSGLDLSVYAAHVLDQKWHFNTLQKPNTILEYRTVSKINMLGTAINIASGSWLLKSEIAFLNGIKYNTTLDKKNRLDALVGFDYMGFKDTVLSLEVANRHIYNHEMQMQSQADFIQKNEMQTVLRATHSFSNDTIDVNALLNMFGSSWENGGFLRVWSEIDVVDALKVNVGYVNYIGGEKPLLEVNKENDKLFADITYSF